MFYEKIFQELEATKSKYLKSCFKAQKPHFTIKDFQDVRLVDSENEYSNLDYEQKQRHTIKYVNVVDNELKIQKMLVVFQSKYLYEQELKNMKEIFTYFFRKDLILNLYDSYFLDGDNTFYVFETEFYETTSEALLEKLNLSNQNLLQIIKKQTDLILELLGIVNRNIEFQIPKKVYIDHSNLNQIQLKINLFDLFKVIQQSLVITLYNQKTVDQVMQIEDNQLKPSEINLDYNSAHIINEKLSFYEQNVLQPSSKDKFLEKIKLISDKDLQNHSFSIFEVISQHPQYNNFQLISVKEKEIQIRLEKSNKNVLLRAIKFGKINEAQNIENEYKKLMKISHYAKSNLIGADIFNLGDSCYLLLELEQKTQDQNYLSESLCKIFLIQEGTYQERISQKNSFNLLKLLIDLSYELLVNYGIRITDIDPKKIMVESNFSEFNLRHFLIDEISFQNQYKLYIDVLFEIFRYLNCFFSKSFIFYNGKVLRDIAHYSYIEKYLKMIQNASNEDLEEIKKQYFTIKKMLDLLEFVIDSNNQGFVASYISFHDPQKLFIDFSETNYIGSIEEKHQILKKRVEFLIQHQELIQKVNLKTSNLFQSLQQQEGYQYHQLNGFSILKENDNQKLKKLQYNITILEEMGFKNTLDYHNYNIGLALCKNLNNLKMLSLKFCYDFDYEIIEKDSNFLKLSEQILRLELNFQKSNENISKILKQVEQYSNINTLIIKANFSIEEQKLKQIIFKIPRLVLANFKELEFGLGFFTQNDDYQGFFF